MKTSARLKRGHSIQGDTSHREQAGMAEVHSRDTDIIYVLKGTATFVTSGTSFNLKSNGRHLGTIIAPMHVRNMAWGDDDGQTLYLCARKGLYKIRLKIPGIRP